MIDMKMVTVFFFFDNLNLNKFFWDILKTNKNKLCDSNINVWSKSEMILCCNMSCNKWINLFMIKTIFVSLPLMLCCWCQEQLFTVNGEWRWSWIWLVKASRDGHRTPKNFLYLPYTLDQPLRHCNVYLSASLVIFCFYCLLVPLLLWVVCTFIQ